MKPDQTNITSLWKDNKNHAHNPLTVPKINANWGYGDDSTCVISALENSTHPDGRQIWKVNFETDILVTKV